VNVQTILVTGSTGLVGSNICKIAVAKGYRVRALVRSKEDTAPLVKLGAELALGDITDRGSLDAPMRGVDFVIHSAAQIGGTWTKATLDDFIQINQNGSVNVLDAAASAGVKRTVQLLTPALFDRSKTYSESSQPLPISPQNSPYQRTKLAAYYEGMARAARGQNIVFSVPGAVYGPAPMLSRAIVPTSFNGTLLMAYRGELDCYIAHVSMWALATDVAEVSLLAMEKGVVGRCYLACGSDDDAFALPELCNRFLALAANPRRVAVFDPATATPEQMAAYGSMSKYLKVTYPKPLVDSSRTTQELGFTPTPVNAGLKQTLEWLRENGEL
jgi:dihydroflavonol-4-reductase